MGSCMRKLPQPYGI